MIGPYRPRNKQTNKHLPDVINMIKLKSSCQPAADDMKTNRKQTKCKMVKNCICNYIQLMDGNMSSEWSEILSPYNMTTHTCSNKNIKNTCSFTKLNIAKRSEILV